MTFRSFIAIALVLMLALTGQSMAVARGASAATGHMVLCTGSGPVAIYFDAQGKPTSAPHICPDSALNVAFDDMMPPLDAPERMITFEKVLPKPVLHAIPQRLERPGPRAPPVTV
ncbi:hypothetical protein [Roseobacter sp. GAI101]|uniref:hypothetical protein n=1 Tax=Roseobacter sp. (strain GAI101) TaxID=391589 RepID=UPI0001871C12|nr:hypothetical protein [Roseobacter sp. GAI101]EEB83849.1 conserved hypothetical protein [Roseobacter sp. GAI101]